MVSPLSCGGRWRFQAVRGCLELRFLSASLQQQTQHAAARPVVWLLQQQRNRQKWRMPAVNPLLRLPHRGSRGSICRHVGGSIRCSATAAGAAATEEKSYKFKSAAHRDMVVLSTRLHLQDLLLQRFGRLRTAECCLLRKSSGTPRLLLLWADLLVQQNPENPPADAYFVPPELYRLPEVKQEVPRYPYEPQQLELLRDTYGLLKWPFRPVRGAAKAAAAAAAAAVTAGNAEVPQISQAEPTTEGVAAAVAAVAAAVDRGDVQRANSKIRTRCCTDAIYAPDETETGAYVW